MNRLFGLSCLSLALLFCAQVSLAQIPRLLSYQGILTDTAGTPKPDGEYMLTFRLYDTKTDGSAFWTETKTIPVERGLFSTQLGDAVAFGASIRFDKAYWLSVQVGGEPELSPRIALSATAYSLNAPQADSARIAGSVPNSSITSAKIANGTIQLADLAQNGAADGQVLKWSGGAWTTAADDVGGGSGTAGGWTDNGALVGLTSAGDTVSINSTSRMGKLNVGGNIGLNSNSKLYFGTSAAQLGSLSGNMAATTESFSFARDGEASWARFDNATKEVGIGTVTMDDRLHVKNDADAPCWIRVETSHPTLWGQAGVRIKTPQNMWNLRMDLHGNGNLPNGALSLHSQDANKEVMTWLEDGKVGVGTKDPIRKFHVNGSAEIEDTVYAAAINANKIVNGPGVVNNNIGYHPLPKSDFLAADSLRVTTQGPGYVLLFVSCGLLVDHDYLDMASGDIAISATHDETGSIGGCLTDLGARLPTDIYNISVACQGVARIPSAGSYEFYVLGRHIGDDAIALNYGTFTALFVPANNGTVELSSRPPQPPGDSAGNAVRPVAGKESLESQLEALRSEVSALKSQVLSQVK